VRVLETRNRSNYLRILLRGEIENNQRPNLVRPEFGFKAEELRDIILARVRSAGGAERDQPAVGETRQAFGHRGVAGGLATRPAVASVAPVNQQVAESISILKRRTLLNAGLILSLFLGMDLWVSGMLLVDYSDVKILRARGVEAVATIDRRYISYSHTRYRSYSRPHLVYSLSLDGVDGARRVYYRDEPADQSEYDAAQIGAQVPACYDPQNPARWRVNVKDWIHNPRPLAPLKAFAFVNLLLAGMMAPFAALFGYFYWQTRRSILAEREPAQNHGFAVGVEHPQGFSRMATDG
jgi:Protein of unknown function (DUF3592)